MKKHSIVILSLCFASQMSMAAKLCGKISDKTKWQGGVFSIIQPDGQTIATTPYITTGNQGCTDFFPSGTYIIRFNGALENTIKFSDDIYGCITAPYIFNDSTLSIVFNQGFPPFNGNSFCYPA
jgi:hypothetical protein